MIDHSTATDMLARRTELTPLEEQHLAGHLQGCAGCRRVAEEYRRQSDLLRTMPIAVPPAALRANVLGAMRHWAPFPVPWYRRRPMFLLSPLVAVVLVVLAALGLSHRSHPSDHAAYFSGAHTVTPQQRLTTLPSPSPTAPHTGRAGPSSVKAHAPHGRVKPQPSPVQGTTLSVVQPTSVPLAPFVPSGSVVVGQRLEPVPTRGPLPGAVPLNPATVPSAGPAATPRPRHRTVVATYPTQVSTGVQSVANAPLPTPVVHVPASPLPVPTATPVRRPMVAPVRPTNTPLGGPVSTNPIATNPIASNPVDTPVPSVPVGATPPSSGAAVPQPTTTTAPSVGVAPTVAPPTPAVTPEP